MHRLGGREELLHVGDQRLAEALVRPLVAEVARAHRRVQVSADAKLLLQGTLRDLASLRAQAASQNQVVQGRAPGLEAAEKARLKEGVNTVSLGGSPIPEDVKKVINAARTRPPSDP